MMNHSPACWAGCTIFTYEETGSTNEDAKRLAAEGAPHGTIVTAKMQNAGKGRRGRHWESPYGKNLYFTLLLKPVFTPDRVSMLTLIMAMAVTRVIKVQCQCKPLIKWPNDIVINGKKICGILTEMQLEGSRVAYVVIGTGINVGVAEFPDDLRETATSLLLECGKEISADISTDKSMEELMTQILVQFEQLYEAFEREQNLTFIKEEYNQHLAGLGQAVRVLDPKGEFAGISRGINEEGELLVENEEQIIKIYAGEVSVRGINGYV